MNGQSKIRINVNPQALIKLASMVSNSLLLSANVVLNHIEQKQLNLGRPSGNGPQENI